MNSYERDQRAYVYYKIFQMLKLHFSGKFNAVLYNMNPPEGTGCFTYSKFSNRRDKKAYYRLVELVPDEDKLKKYLVPIFASSKKNIKSIFDITDKLQENAEIYEEWSKRVDNIKENFCSDIKKLKIKEYLDGPEKLFLDYYSGKIQLESFCLIDSLLLKKYKNKTISNLYKNLIIKCRAYRVFLKYDNKDLLRWIKS